MGYLRISALALAVIGLGALESAAQAAPGAVAGELARAVSAADNLNAPIPVAGCHRRWRRHHVPEWHVRTLAPP